MILLFSVFVLIYFHRVLIMFCLSPITAWATRHHNVLGSFIGAETSTHTEYANFSIRMYIRYKLRKRSLYIPELKYGIHPAYALEKEASSGIMRF